MMAMASAPMMGAMAAPAKAQEMCSAAIEEDDLMTRLMALDSGPVSAPSKTQEEKDLAELDGLFADNCEVFEAKKSKI